MGDNLPNETHTKSCEKIELPKYKNIRKNVKIADKIKRRNKMQSNDWTGNQNSVYKTLGASNHTDKDRETNDYYATDPIAIDVLLNEGGKTIP